MRSTGNRSAFFFIPRKPVEIIKRSFPGSDPLPLPDSLPFVLWIRTRNNPNVLAGSESEKKVRIRIHTHCRIKIFVKNKKSNT
jgi:hypothetical protein